MRTCKGLEFEPSSLRRMSRMVLCACKGMDARQAFESALVVDRVAQRFAKEDDAPADDKKSGKPKTFMEARNRLLDYLESKHWKLSSRTLKIPYATSPDGKHRLWFKTQAVYLSSGGGRHDFGDARTVSYDTNDLKNMSPEQYVRHAIRE